jgi:hypothetical protein
LSCSTNHVIDSTLLDAASAHAAPHWNNVVTVLTPHLGINHRALYAEFGSDFEAKPE